MSKIIVTGAFSYTGKYITRRLLDQGAQVITLTNHPNRPDPFAGRVKAFPLDFSQPARLAEVLRGADVLVVSSGAVALGPPSTFREAVQLVAFTVPPALSRPAPLVASPLATVRLASAH